MIKYFRSHIQDINILIIFFPCDYSHDFNKFKKALIVHTTYSSLLFIHHLQWFCLVYLSPFKLMKYQDWRPKSMQVWNGSNWKVFPYYPLPFHQQLLPSHKHCNATFICVSCSIWCPIHIFQKFPPLPISASMSNSCSGHFCHYHIHSAKCKGIFWHRW